MKTILVPPEKQILFIKSSTKKEGQMKYRQFFISSSKYTALFFFLLSGVLLTYGTAMSTVISLSGDKDAQGFYNHDSASGGVDPAQSFPGVSARFAPIGSRDGNSPPGIIEEARYIMEFDLSSLASISAPIGSAVLNLSPKELINESNSPLAFPIYIFVNGYAGNGEIVFDDFSAGNQAGTFSIGTTDPVHVNVTSFINGLLSINASWAGFTLLVDYNSLPPRNTLTDDTTTGVEFYSADNTTGGPTLEITAAAAVPEPSTLLLLGSGLIGVLAYGRKKLFSR